MAATLSVFKSQRWIVAWAVLLFTSLQFPSVSGQSLYISQICPVNKHQLLTLVEVDDDDQNTSGTPAYRVYKDDDDDDDAVVTETELGTEDTDSEDLSLFRECLCPRPTGHSTPIACPLDSRFCAVPTDISLPVMCYAEDASVMVVRNIWPLMCLWYLCFILFVCCSYKGRQAVLYCLGKCFPSLNETLVERMLQRQRRQWTLNFWHAARARNLTAWNEATANTVTANGGSLVEEPVRALDLRTKKYEAAPLLNDGDEEDYDEDDHCCTICFVPLEEGDRVGDLECNHMFHVDCLKSWVQRKNTCPLCAAPMATPSRKWPNTHAQSSIATTTTTAPTEAGMDATTAAPTTTSASFSTNTTTTTVLEDSNV